jgi:iron complex transport system substrate-binding protein
MVSSSSRRAALPRLLLAFSMLAAAGPALADGPQRVVSIGGGTTEILYALGEEDRIAAVDSTSFFPPEATEKQDVGYIRALSPEGVLSVAPDLIIMEADAGPATAVSVIESAGIPIVRVPSGHGIEELAEKLVLVASAVGREADGQAMADEVVSDLDALTSDLADVSPRRRVLFILSLVDGRVMAAGTDTGADAIIAMAGGENVFAEAEGYKTISPEAAAALAPDVILMMERGDGQGEDPMAIPALAATPAGQTGAIIRMDALYLLGFGPRTVSAARDLADQFYPDLGLAAASPNGG